MQEILTNLCRYCWGWLFPYSSVFSLWLKLNSAGEEGSWFFVFTFIFCMYFSAIHPFDECVSLNVCQLSVVRGPVPLPPRSNCSLITRPALRSWLPPPPPLNQPMLLYQPSSSSSFSSSQPPQPLQYPFLAGLPCTGACSNVQLHRKPLFTNQLPQVKPTVTRSFFFFLQIFWQTYPKLWKSIRLKGRMSRNI